jgi:hypothetical protein
MTLLERIKANRKETEEIRNLLDSIESYYNTPYVEMYEYYHQMKQKSAEKFIEGWVAFHTGTKKKDSVSYDKNNDIDGLDLGDLVAGELLVPGKNNIELKVSFASGNDIGGGQLRFYEDVAGYLFMKAWSTTKVEYFYLTKAELIDEIKTRATTPYKINKKTGEPVFYEAFTSSQGSGKFKKRDNATRLQVLQENLDKNRQDLLGWSFNSKTEPELYKSWQAKYLKTPAELTQIFKEIAIGI